MENTLGGLLKAASVLMMAVMLSSCSQTPSHPLYKQSNGVYTGVGFSSFADYQKASRSWLSRNRVFLSQDRKSEIEMNMPYSVEPDPASPLGKRKGIILVHGLGDSPWSFTDLAREFSRNGYLVRTVLLAGHGTRPADMLSIDDSEWENLVREQVAILKRDVDEVSLGGFSTGANLVTSYALNDPDIRSLFLFSPAFKSDEDYDYLTPLAAVFKDWLFTPAPLKMDNLARYSTVPLNGFAQYYQTSATVREHLKAKTFDRPVFIATTEADSVVDVKNTVRLFEQRFTHVASHLVWFGSSLETQDTRIKVFPGRIPEFKVSNFSHMGILFSPMNEYYGEHGSYRMCNNGQNEAKKTQCEQGALVWYSAWGYQEDAKIHARLTFNPHFKKMVEVIRQVVRAE